MDPEGVEEGDDEAYAELVRQLQHAVEHAKPPLVERHGAVAAVDVEVVAITVREHIDAGDLAAHLLHAAEGVGNLEVRRLTHVYAGPRVRKLYAVQVWNVHRGEVEALAVEEQAATGSGLDVARKLLANASGAVQGASRLRRRARDDGSQDEQALVHTKHVCLSVVVGR
eukprot:5154053-Prymnesium_polylepis.1